MQTLHSHQYQRRFAAQLLSFILAVLIAVSTPLEAVSHSPELPNPGSPGMTKEQQEQLGLKASAEVYKQMPVLPESHPLTQYVQQLGRRLETVIPQQYSWPYQFRVIQQKEINAFALPGGPIFINVGAINAADNEAELAGVMAHEMSHVYMQHSAKQVRQNTIPSILSGLGQIAGRVFGGVGGAIASIGGQMVGGMMSMKYSRADEAQADAVGAIIMYKAGYDPRAMAEFFAKLEKEGGGAGPQFLSDHPNPGNRVEAVTKEIADWPRKNFITTSPDFARVKQEASSVKVYTAQQIADGAKQGVWARQNAQSGSVPRNLPVSENENENGPAGSSADLANVTYSQVQPSGNFRVVDANGFSISAPDNWQTHNSQTGMLIAPSAGASSNAIAYGVIVNSAQDQNASSLDQATQDLIRNLQQNNPELQVTGSVQQIRVNGTDARSVNLSGTSPVQDNGQRMREHDWLITLPASGSSSFVYVISIAPERDFGRLRSTYEKMLQSLQVK